MNILINLPPAFFACERFQPCFERLRAIGPVRTSSHNTVEEIRDDLSWADAVLMWSWPVFDGALIDACGGLRWLGQIDTSRTTAETCLERSIPLSLNKRAWSPAVAEMALGLCIDGLRGISAHHLAMRAGTEAWAGLWPEGVDARERSLDEVRVGLVGYGGVGQRLRALLAPHGCVVATYDPYIPDDLCSAQQVERCELEALLRSSDVLIVCAAANADSRALIGARELALLPQDALLINVARAALVDTEALLAWLQADRGSACIDVFDVEPLAADHPLRSCPRAWLTPHRAGGILRSGLRALSGLIDDLDAHLGGRPMTHAFGASMLPSLDG